VKKYVELVLRKQVTSYVSVVVDTDLEDADLERASFTPLDDHGVALSWRDWLKDYYRDPEATEYELDGVYVLERPYVTEEELVPFLAEREEEEGGDK
jgi:hypothetical protein